MEGFFYKFAYPSGFDAVAALKMLEDYLFKKEKELGRLDSFCFFVPKDNLETVYYWSLFDSIDDPLFYGEFLEKGFLPIVSDRETFLKTLPKNLNDSHSFGSPRMLKEFTGQSRNLR
jgi:hypothetical protein